MLLRPFDADTGQTLYYESADAAQQHLEEAGDALGDAVCDAIAEYGCNAHPECCGAVRSHLDLCRFCLSSRENVCD